MENLTEIILHSDDALLELAGENLYGAYIFLFILVMLETGVILFPFLPGDGLLFSAGVISASTGLDIRILIPLLIAAALLGNVLNYLVGFYLGQKMRKSENYLVKKYLMRHLPKTEAFYRKHGGAAIFLGRFFPVIRTYIPFLAGIVKLGFPRFIRFSLTGAMAWICIFSLTGYFTGEIEWVKNNYGFIYLGLVVVTMIPFFIPLLIRTGRKILMKN